MKIIKSDSPTVNFRSLVAGQVFIVPSSSGVYMKTQNEGDETDTNAIDLEEGAETSFSPSAQVVHYPAAALHLTPSNK